MNFDSHDKLERKPFAEKLERYLLVEHDFVEGSLVVSLDAPFGAGKTTFLDMWEADLEKRRESDPQLPPVIRLNAWESDYCGDPLLSIVTSLIHAVTGTQAGVTIAGENTPGERLREAAKDAVWFVTALANGLAAQWTGVDAISAGEFAEHKKRDRNVKRPDLVALYEERTAALKDLKGALREVFGGEAPKALILVDELDRCRPDYAITYLETIKHVFDVHGLVFVLALDYKQLECSAKALFGSDLKFAEYFRKFSHRSIRLPRPDQKTHGVLIHDYVSTYIQREGKRVSKLRLDEGGLAGLHNLAFALALNPRQAQEVLRILGHSATGGPESRGRIHPYYGQGLILMSVLCVANELVYRGIGEETMPDEDVGKFLIQTVGTQNANLWMRIYLHGKYAPEPKNLKHMARLFNMLKLSDAEGSATIMTQSADYRAGWGNPISNIWMTIYKRIETATNL